MSKPEIESSLTRITNSLSEEGMSNVKDAAN